MISVALVVMMMVSPPADSSSRALSPEVQRVVVSWYGPGLQGNPMANGERFDRHCVETVAHKTLPFGTRVWFRNPINGYQLIAKVKDRGPYSPGRDFDLSEAAAERLDFKAQGEATLEVLVMEAGP